MPNHQQLSTAKTSIITALKTQWLNPQKKRFWLIIAILAYTLLGFFAAPLLIKNSILSLIHKDLNRNAHIERVELNPYSLSLSIQGFEMIDQDEVRLATFDEFFVNFQLSSLFRWAWTFDEIRLTAPYFFFERFKENDSRLSRLLPPSDEEQTVAANDKGDSGLPRLLIQNLILQTGRINAKDSVPADAVETQLGPIDITIHELNTLPDRNGQQVVEIKLTEHSSLRWEGSLNLAPFNSEGELQLENLPLDQASSYLKTLPPLDSLRAKLSTRLHYRVQQLSSGDLDIDIDQLDIELSELAVSGLTPRSDFLSIANVSLLGGALRYPEQSLQFSSLRIDQPQLTAWLDSDGALSLAQLAVDQQDETVSSEPTDDTPWLLAIDEFQLQQGQLKLSDHSVKPAATFSINNLQARLTKLNNRDSSLFPLELSASLAEQGRFKLEGSLGLLPEPSLLANSQTRNIPLSLVQPYLQQTLHASIKSGTLDSDIDIALPAGGTATISGALRIHELDIQDTQLKQRLLSWKKLDIDQFKLDLGKGELQLSRLLFEHPYGNVVIHKDQSSNISDLVIVQKTATATASTDDKQQAMVVTLGGILIEHGAMDFTDSSLPLPFSTHITQLEGTVSTIATDSSEPANLRIEGQVDKYGLARIEGSINVLDPTQKTAIQIQFRNLAMSNFSPYSAQFTGRKIDKGKIELGLRYNIDKGLLDGNNELVIRDLALGEKVDSPDASNLPLDLAIALLKDADGKIDVKLPVGGNVDDPDFQIGGVIWDAFTGLITDVAAAPFRMLGNLLGINAEELGQVEFLAGRADLTPPEREKIAQLQQALAQRPQLIIEISGVSAAAIDIAALKYSSLKSNLLARMGEDSIRNRESDIMLDVEIRSQLEILFIERFPATSLKALKAEHRLPPADDPTGKPQLDELAYAIDLKDRLLASENIGEPELLILAQARAEAVSRAFLASGEFASDRVVISEPTQVDSEDSEWVVMTLGVTTN